MSSIENFSVTAEDNHDAFVVQILDNPLREHAAQNRARSRDESHETVR
jgi:hypothetical protein